ncbi:MAG TPA: ATP-binding cassette domain-containing protein, partial [Thermoanaerobaculia bacterium]|nr:ATP-binding cassette domain-containing protein [Thermoanaerobaculia bacterium]
MTTLFVRFVRRFPAGPAIRAELDLPLGGAEVTVLFGPSGAGKTTILRCLAGLEVPDEGTIRLGAETWFDADARVNRPPQARRVGFLFQDHALFPHLTVAGNVAFGLAGLPRAECARRVADGLSFVGLSALADRRPRELSGGESQRVALARALARRPALLLLDEPLSALDSPLRIRLRGELRTLLTSLEIPSVVVTHDRAEALALGDRVAVVAEGGVRQTGPVDEVFSRPTDVGVARVTGVECVLPGRVVAEAD